MVDPTSLAKKTMKLDCIHDSRFLKNNSNSRISSAACSSKFLANGTFEGGVILHDIENPDCVKLHGEFSLTRNSDGITNCLALSKDNSKLFIASNDLTTQILDLGKGRVALKSETPFAINALALNPHNPALALLIGDNVDGIIVDYRCLQSNLQPSHTLQGHKDFGFCCDWSPTNERLLITGNQDGTMRLWDNRMMAESLNCWNSALGASTYDSNAASLGGPVRNCTFSYYGDYIVWAETLDHVGIAKASELSAHVPEQNLNVQSIDFIGKCIGINVCPTDGRNEQLVIGVNDHPLGGILSYNLETTALPQFNFLF